MFMATCKYCGQKLTQKEIDISKKRGKNLCSKCRMW